MSDKPLNVNLVNFGSKLSDNIIQDIEAEQKLKITQIVIPFSMNLKKHSIAIQVHDIFERNKSSFIECDDVIINLPGLPIGVCFVIIEAYALLGALPKIVECIKDFEDGLFTQFKYKRIYNLDLEKTSSRTTYISEKYKKEE
jgi:hypothetical protein